MLTFHKSLNKLLKKVPVNENLIVHLFTNQLAGVLRSEIFFKSSKQSKCGNANRAWRRKYGNKS